MYKRNSI